MFLVYILKPENIFLNQEFYNLKLSCDHINFAFIKVGHLELPNGYFTLTILQLVEAMAEYGHKMQD